MKKLILLLTIAVVVTECGMHNRISSLRDNHVSAGLALPQETFIPSLKNRQEEKDTIEVSEPENVMIMNAVKDENGEMTATDVIRAAMVTARFRNVAERHGKVDLEFQVVVPGELQDSRWQLKLYPDMFVMEDSIRLEPVVVTGAQYRRRQMKGYEQYRKFLDSIISDPDSFIFAETDGQKHNTITPIARKHGENYELDLVLRNNITTDEHPMCVYHPHANLHHIKKENIGLIEVMGLAVLPSRLKTEMAELADALVNALPVSEYSENIAKHAQWAQEIQRRYEITRDNVEGILRKEIGMVFAQVLEDSGVYKLDEFGREGFVRFLASVK